MNRAEDSFLTLAAEASAEDSTALGSLEAGSGSPARAMGAEAPPAVGRLQGFNLLDQPLIANLAGRDGELLTARTTVPLRRSMIGRDVLVVFDRGDVRAPIIVGVIEAGALASDPPSPEVSVAVQVDGERHVIEAEREIVLRCGEASITLTRAGKVIIKGNYILSRSTGYNKIKGAAIDIN